MLKQCLLFAVVATLTIDLRAGDITGAPAVLPPQLLGNFSFLWSNDFFGSGGVSDDYRTQQLGLQIKLKPKWGLIFDHSILTTSEDNAVLPGVSGRLDQISLSLMYDIYLQEVEENYLAEIKAGVGFRSYGNFGGSRMQNGFHRLINSSGDNYPYVDTKNTTAIAWVMGNYQRLYQLQPLIGSDTGWRAGYWLNATTLASADGEWDAALAANAVIRNQAVAIWLGLREDWRENYDADFVQKATAESETGTSLTLGLSMGPVLFETAQGFGDKTSYGRFIFTSVENQYSTMGASRGNSNAISLNLLTPDIEVALQYRRALSYRPEAVGAPIMWFLFGVRYGKPSFRDSFDVYNQTQQAAVGLELEWRKHRNHEWVWPYVNLQAGQRTEQLRASTGALAGEESEQVSSPVIEAGTGLRFTLYPSRSWQLLFQLGLVGYYPTASKTVVFDQSEIELLTADVAANLGFSLTFGIE